jgi:hypothetical protein
MKKLIVRAILAVAAAELDYPAHLKVRPTGKDRQR